MFRALVSVAFLWIAFKNIDLSIVWHVIRSANIWWGLLGLVLYVISLNIRIWRWMVMLRPSNNAITFRMCASPFMGSMTMNNFLPFRVGDVVRIIAYSKPLGITSSSSLASLLLERVLDVFISVFPLGIIALYIDTPESITISIKSLPLFCFLSAFLLLMGVFQIKTIFTLASRFAQKIGATRIAPIKKAIQFFESCVEEIAKIMASHTAYKFFGATVVIWMADAAFFYSVALSIPALVFPLAAVPALSASNLSLVIPSAPGGIGPLDYMIIVVMTVLGNDATGASAFAVVVHFYLLFVPLLTLISFLSVRFFARFTLNQRNSA